MCFFPGRGLERREKKVEEGRGFAAETVGPELWRAKGLEEAPVTGRPTGVQEHGWVPKCNLAYRML